MGYQHHDPTARYWYELRLGSHCYLRPRLPSATGLQGQKYRHVEDSLPAAHFLLLLRARYSNVANEAGAYLQYIIDHYDCLPSAMAFIHGHENETWHAASMHEVGRRSCSTRRLYRLQMLVQTMLNC